MVDLDQEVAFQNPVGASCGTLSKTKVESVPRQLRTLPLECGFCVDGAELGRTKVAGWCFEVRNQLSANIATGSGAQLPSVFDRDFSDLLVGLSWTIEVPLTSFLNGCFAARPTTH